MHNDVKKILYNKEDIEKACIKLGEQITNDYKDKKILIVGILKGSFLFVADLIRNIKLDCKIDFMEVSSYYGKSTKSSGVITITKNLEIPVKEHHVIIVEDIIDTGNTLFHIKKLLKDSGAKSIKLCTLFNKPSRREIEIQPDYCGFDVENEFIIGYGLDYDENYRNLPYVGVLKPELYN